MSLVICDSVVHLSISGRAEFDYQQKNKKKEQRGKLKNMKAVGVTLHQNPKIEFSKRKSPFFHDRNFFDDFC